MIIPKSGFIIPNMGTKKRPAKTLPLPVSGIADALFTKVQQRVLAVLFGNPGRSFYANEVIALAGSGTGAVQRELARLEMAGLATVTRVGNQKHYQANTAAPVFEELKRFRVTDAEALPGYRLSVRFSNNTEGEIDLKDFSAADARPIVAALRDQSAFSAIREELDTVVWANGFDLAPESLHARAKAHAARKFVLIVSGGEPVLSCARRA